MDEWMNEWMIGRMNEYTEEVKSTFILAPIKLARVQYNWMDEIMIWMDEWMDEWTNRRVLVNIYTFSPHTSMAVVRFSWMDDQQWMNEWMNDWTNEWIHRRG